MHSARRSAASLLPPSVAHQFKLCARPSIVEMDKPARLGKEGGAEGAAMTATSALSAVRRALINSTRTASHLFADVEAKYAR